MILRTIDKGEKMAQFMEIFEANPSGQVSDSDPDQKKGSADSK
jgi:hypothetical protein